MMTTLTAARDALATITGVLTCKIGLEPAISPNDFPLIRIAPERITSGKPYGNRTCEALIFFGVPVTLAEELEVVYTDLFALEALIIAELSAAGGRYIETLTANRAELQLPYNMMAIRCELRGSP